MKKFGSLALMLVSLQCAQLQQEVADETRASSNNCRNYVTSYITGGNTYNCSWDGGTLRFVCVSAGNTSTYQYPSLGKFIQEPKTVGKFFFTSVVITGSGPSTTTNTYDGLERLVSIHTTASGATLDFAYSTYDGVGRPLSGLYNVSASGFTCVNANVTRAYDDSARTMTESISGGSGVICQNLTSTSTYDAATGVDVSTSSTLYGTIIKTITGTAQLCQ